MRLGVLGLASLWSGVADAAEVVWLSPPTEADAARVAALAGARRGPLSAAAFRALATDVSPSDDAAVEAVERALAQVRVHETVLDGERLILEGLEPQLAAVHLLRSERDRDVVFRALLYQGFAADRYWGAGLADAPDAVPYRTRVEDRVLARPWLDAFALDPLRKPTESDIGEAPHRAAYEDVRRDLARALRATIVAAELPPGGTLVVDGGEVLASDVALLEVLPGRHWVHVALEGHILARHDVRLDPGQRWEVSIPVSEDDWRATVRAVRAATPIPASSAVIVQSLGGEVWFAEGAGPTLRVWRASPVATQAVALTVTAPPGPGTSSVIGDVSVAGWVGPSYLYSPDFSRQREGLDDPSVNHAFAPGAGIEIAWDRAWLRYGLFTEVQVPVGRDHVAFSGAAAYRARFLPGVSLGHPLVQANFGWMFPYHAVVGAQCTVPLPDLPLEVRAWVRGGPGHDQLRTDGSEYPGSPIFLVGAGVGTRLRPP